MKAKVIMNQIILNVDKINKSYHKGDIIELDEANMSAWIRAGIVEPCPASDEDEVVFDLESSDEKAEEVLTYHLPIKRRNKRK